MKCLFCLRCGDLVQMKLQEFKGCSCGNVQGRYKDDGHTIEVTFQNSDLARVVGISNSFLREEKTPLDDPIYNNTLFRHYKSLIIMIRPFTTGDVVSLLEDKEK